MVENRDIIDTIQKYCKYVYKIIVVAHFSQDKLTFPASADMDKWNPVSTSYGTGWVNYIVSDVCSSCTVTPYCTCVLISQHLMIYWAHQHPHLLIWTQISVFLCFCVFCLVLREIRTLKINYDYVSYHVCCNKSNALWSCQRKPNYPCMFPIKQL